VARQDEYDREFLEYEDPAIYKALMQQEASERPTYSSTGTMFENLPDNVYRSGEGRRAVASALGNIIGDNYATGLIGGGTIGKVPYGTKNLNKYAGLGVLDLIGVGGTIDLVDSWNFFNKINADKARVENELIEEGYDPNSESFDDEVTNRMPEYHGKGEALFHGLLGPLEIAALGATKMVAGGRVVKNALNKKIDMIGRKLMSLKGEPGALPVVDNTTSGALPSGNLSDNIQAIRDSAENLKSKKKLELGALPNGESGVAKVTPPTDNQPGIIAFHGSGADFDQFRLDKIGTGEGVAAYGHGLYFSDTEDIAKFYKDTLTEVPHDYQLDGQSVSKLYNDALNNENYQLAEVLEQVQLHDSPKELIEKFSVKNGYPKETEDFVKGLNYDRITAIDFDGNKLPLGRTYKVALSPKPEELLDYDERLIDQPVKIQNAIRELYQKHAYKGLNSAPEGGWSTGQLTAKEMIFMGLFPTSSGAQVYRTIAEKLNPNELIPYAEMSTAQIRKAIKDEYAGGEASMSMLLNQYGVKGIKYLDNASRNTSGGKLLDINKLDDGKFQARIVLDSSTRQTGLGGTGRVITKKDNFKTKEEAKNWVDSKIGKKDNNYVIFDDKLINILAKYGIVGPVAITTLGSLPSEEKTNRLNFRS